MSIGSSVRAVRYAVCVIGVCAVTLGWGGAAGHASELIDRDATVISFKVNELGQAGIVYRTPSKGVRYVLAWGAVNALAPTRGGQQVAFRKDYAGGWSAYRGNVVKTMRNVCEPYDGPALPWLLQACKAPDGTYWALQGWQRALPNLGLEPWKPEQRVTELHLSHWSGDLPVLTVYTDWVYSKRFHHLFGTFVYQGSPVYGFSSTSSGVPLDSWGRNVYLDTLDSAYGSGWKRENSFLAHTGTGVFCYGFYEHDPYPGYPSGRRPRGDGSRYRITAMGPGVTPLVIWEGDDPGEYDANDAATVAREREMNELQRSFGDDRCLIN